MRDLRAILGEGAAPLGINRKFSACGKGPLAPDLPPARREREVGARRHRLQGVP
jgi:hypothetical protein